MPPPPGPECPTCGNPVPAGTSHCPFCEHALPAGTVRGRRTGAIRIVNLEADRPPVEEALRRFRSAIQEGLLRGDRVLKLIHGYGSSGEGGRIREAVRRHLVVLEERGRIAGFFPGEALSAGSTATRQLRERMTGKGREDPDLRRGNPGITFVLFR